MTSSALYSEMRFSCVKGLGAVSYIWIDSLCIIQDDISDWMVQSQKMAQLWILLSRLVLLLFCCMPTVPAIQRGSCRIGIWWSACSSGRMGIRISNTLWWLAGVALGRMGIHITGVLGFAGWGSQAVDWWTEQLRDRNPWSISMMRKSRRLGLYNWFSWIFPYWLPLSSYLVHDVTIWRRGDNP